ncbi:SDR family NAD(P)-dependent oxidoreductase [Actinomycetota bacterium]
MESVSGLRVLVTGAAMGLGRLFVERALAEGAASVVMWDVNEAALNSAAEAMGATPDRVLSHVVDVRDLDQIRWAADDVRESIGGVDIVINNAGVVRGNRYFWETDVEKDARFTMEVNALAPMYVAREFLPGMIETGRPARLVTIASAAGLTSNPRMAAYAASKWAAIGWSDSVRLEIEQAGHDHVKVTTVCPYYTKTGMFDGARSAPLLPLLEPEDVVNQTWSAMLTGKAMVVMPQTVLLSETMKGILPTGWRDFVAGRLGIYHTMDDFRGRTDQHG